VLDLLPGHLTKIQLLSQSADSNISCKDPVTVFQSCTYTSKTTGVPTRTQVSAYMMAGVDDAQGSSRDSSRLNTPSKLTLWRFLQDLNDAEIPPSPVAPKYHTGKLPNSKSGDGKPRLLLMGQRRQVSHCIILEGRQSD
jgi:hypothetical protein